MRKVRLGVVGCGTISRFHLAPAVEMSELIDVLAVADVVEAKAKAMAERFNVPRIYPSGEALIDDPDINAVVLALPTCYRTPLALKAFRQGKHVLTEKPVGMDAAEVRRMIEAKGDLIGACCSSRPRFLESAQVAADFIARGELGDLRMIHGRGLAPAKPAPGQLPPAWRLKRALNGGGILVNWGCYDLDFLLGITGWSLKPQTVFAQTWPIPPQLASHVPPDSDAETHVAALIRCAEGVMINLERAEYIGARQEENYHIIGTKGSLNLQMVPTAGMTVVCHRTSDKEGVVSETIWEGDQVYDTINAGPVRDFARAIDRGGSPKTSLEQALVVQEITDAIYASAESGRAMDIPKSGA